MTKNYTYVVLEKTQNAAGLKHITNSSMCRFEVSLEVDINILTFSFYSVINLFCYLFD